MGIWLVVVLLALAVCVTVATGVYSRRRREKASRDANEGKHY
jgi:hypothetical protein